MEDHDKTREQLVTDLEAMGRRIAELEILEITHRQAEKEIRGRTRQLEILRQVELPATADLDLDILLHSIASRAVELLGGSCGRLYLHQQERDVLGLAVVVGPCDTSVGATLHRGEGLPGRAWETGEVLIGNDCAPEERWPVTAGDLVAHIIGAPIRHGPATGARSEPEGERGFIGVLNVSRDVSHPFSSSDATLLSLFAANAANAIHNAQLFAAEREQRELAEALEEAAAAVGSTLEIDQVLDRIFEQVERVVAGDAFNIMLIEGDMARITRSRGYERLDAIDAAPDLTIPVARFPSFRKMTEGEGPILIRDTAIDPDWIAQEHPWPWRSYVAAPIRLGTVTVGFLNVNSTRPDQFSPADAQRLKAFANHAAIAIENARLYREQLLYTEDLEQRVQERTAQLQAQFARLKAVLHSTTDCIVVTGQQGDIIQANPSAESWLTQTLSPQDGHQLRRAMLDLTQRVEASGHTGGVQPRQTLELSDLVLELKAAPISTPATHEADDEAVAVVTIHDVSHLKALDRIRARFGSAVSHELQTPITTIKLYISLIQRSPTEKWQEYIAVMAQEMDRLARLVKDIVQITRIDTGRLRLRRQLVPVNKLVEDVIATLQAQAQDRGVSLVHHIPQDVGPVKVSVDPGRIAQALNNLVRNGIQHTHLGGKVMVSAEMKQVEGCIWAIVKVTGTGISIPEDELPHTFERFFQGAKQQAVQSPGTGLGLAIAKEIIVLHGGQVTVESQVDVGTTFTVRLPQVERMTPRVPGL